MALFVLALDWARVKDTSPKTILKLMKQKIKQVKKGTKQKNGKKKKTPPKMKNVKENPMNKLKRN